MHYLVGEVVEGYITGIKPYGAFVFLDSSHKGLIHISEISDYFVKDVHSFVHVNDRVKVKILDVDEDGTHLKLSLKAVATNKVRYSKCHKRKVQYPKMEIGFSSLAEHLDSWIDEASR
ncbi:MAG: S1 RNA-binding domain-containing protein [Erysipelotrichaceae bacterium]|nr:S1 RNA-binding domain-containing protein [Erysipelotrichaceae bacterium]